jgi:hypothetical protein
MIASKFLLGSCFKSLLPKLFIMVFLSSLIHATSVPTRGCNNDNSGDKSRQIRHFFSVYLYLRE